MGEEKKSFPIKTKIVAWWIMILGGGGIIIGLILVVFALYFDIKLSRSFLEFFNFFLGTFSSLEVLIPFIIAFFSSLFFLISGFYILKRKKHGWDLAMIAIFIGIVVGILFPREKFIMKIADLFASVIPFILLLLDRKNFLKTAS